MLEIWVQKARDGITGQGPKRSRRLRFLPPGLWVIIIVLALVGCRLLWIEASRPAHRLEITDAFGSVSLFFGVPQVSHDNSRFTYVATDAKGYALLLCDTNTGRKQVVREENGLGPSGDAFDLHAWPWSPDDSAFIYTTRNKLFICSPADLSAANRASLNAHGVSAVVWLNPSKFAWLEPGMICYARRPAGGKWKVFRLPHRGLMTSLTAVDTHTIAWLQEDFICRLDLNGLLTETKTPLVLLRPDACPVPLTNNLVLWLDASTLDLDDEAPVTGLADLSREHNSAVPNQNPPAYNAPDSPAGLNRKGTIHFESGNLLEATGLKTTRRLALAGSHPRSIFVVMRRDAGRSMMLINTGSTLTNGAYVGLYDRYDHLSLPSGNLPTMKGGSRKPLPASWHILGTVYDGKSGKGYVNGAFRAAVTLPFNTADKEVEIGLRTTNNKSLTNSAASDGDFAELLIYDRALSATEQRQVEDYLGAKWFGYRPLSHQHSLVWLDPEMDGLTGFSYSKETGRFLIHRSEILHHAQSGRDSLWLMDSKTAVSTNASLVMKGRFIRNPQWTGTNEFAYTSQAPGHSGLVLADLSSGEKNRLFELGNIGWFKVAPDQKKLLFWGNVSNEPSAGIWQYDLASRQLQSFAPGSDTSSPYARALAPFHGAIKLPSGNSVNCVIYPPAHLDRHKQYPLVIGDTVFGVAVNGAHGRLWAPAIASCGAFVVIIERSKWMVGLEQWGGHVMGVYKYLAQDPCIDTGRVFLFGASAETKYMSEFMAKSPGLWKGAIYLNPVGLPDFSKSPPFQSRPKVLISTGGVEHQEEHFKQFQTNAVNSGVLAEIIVHPDENHHLVGNTAQLERTKAMMHFIFEE